MPDIPDRFAALRRDVDGASLVDAALLRRHADRRARRRAALVIAGVAAALALVSGGVGAVVNRSAAPDVAPAAPATERPEPSPSASPSPSPEASVTPTQDGGTPPSAEAPRTIPLSAFFDMPADLYRFERTPSDGDRALPRLCGQEFAPGEGVVASAAMMNVYKRPEDPPTNVPSGVLYQTIRSYEGDTAARFMDRVRDRLADCESYRDGEATVRVRAAPLPGVGDEALTIDRVQPQRDLPGNLEPAGGEQINQIVVIRFGTVVTILNDTEYERSSSVPAIVEVFVREAAQAIRTWLR